MLLVIAVVGCLLDGWADFPPPIYVVRRQQEYRLMKVRSMLKIAVTKVVERAIKSAHRKNESMWYMNRLCSLLVPGTIRSELLGVQGSIGRVILTLGWKQRDTRTCNSNDHSFYQVLRWLRVTVSLAGVCLGDMTG